MSQPTNTTTGGHDHKDSAAATIWMAISGASAGDHHEEKPGVDTTAKKVGHEADRFNTTTIWAVPVLVSLTLLFVYGVVQGVFSFIVDKSPEQKDLPGFNERTGRIATTGAQPIKDGLPAVPQPRLEFVQKLDLTRNNVNGDIVVDPPYMRSFKPTPTGNSPEIYPEDLRTEHFVDPTFKTKALSEASWANKEKTIAVLPIDEVLHMMTHDAAYKLKVAATPSAPLVGTIGKPKLSTGGITPAKPTAAKPAEPKKDDHH